MLTPGLYEQVISKALGKAIDGDSEHYIETLPIDAEEASKILSRYITEILEKGLENVKDQGGDLRAQVDVANRIVQILADATGNTEVDLLSVDARAEQLMALINKQNSISPGSSVYRRNRNNSSPFYPIPVFDTVSVCLRFL
jgi:VIT1/CCC1 family predicted Fe2+/Mn2+ transporter